MPRVKKTTPELPRKRLPPTTSPEARENQLISLAIDLAEQQLMDGTASAQVITHYLKLASKKEALEQAIMEKQAELLAAKTEAVQSAKRTEELYANALAAMKRYSGGSDDDYYDSDL